MGRTVTQYKMVLYRERKKWRQAEKYLPRSERHPFDDMIVNSRRAADAASMAVRCIHPLRGRLHVGALRALQGAREAEKGVR